MRYIDNYIGSRYNPLIEYIGSRYNDERYSGSRYNYRREERIDMGQFALTEAVYYILLSLQTPLHGYGIIQNVEALSNGRVKLAPGTLYGAINTLLEKKWISALEENPESRKKEYVITEQGRSVVREELDRLRELVNNGQDILGEK